MKLFTSILIATSLITMTGFRSSLPRQASALFTKEKHCPRVYHDTWRDLWSEQVVWTRMMILSITDESPGLEQAKIKLLQNDNSLEDILKAFYAEEAVKLADMIQEHVLISVEVFEAAKFKDTAMSRDALLRWRFNAERIALKMNRMNPQSWKRDAGEALWRDYIDATLEELEARLGGDYEADAHAYEKLKAQSIKMADFFSSGMVGEFRSNFAPRGIF